MGRLERALWKSDPMAPTHKDRMGGVYSPYLPDKLAGSELVLSMDAARSCERAALALSGLDARARSVTAAESLTNVLLRVEALSSSSIEGLEMGVRRLLEVEALDELGVPYRLGSVEAEVLGNVEALEQAVGLAQGARAMKLTDILQMHATLLRHTRLKELGGVLRTSQNWIGGSWYNPLGARYVPPPPERVPPLMEDLVSFVADSRLPVVATAAIAHAQLETIHPFADGNGRVGRALVHAVLRRGGLATSTVAPTSPVLLTLRDQYYDALEAYRFDEREAGAPTLSETASAWIEFFCHVTAQACERARAFDASMHALRDGWDEVVRPRAGSATQRLLDILPGNPVVSITSAARLTQEGYPATRSAVRALEEAKVLVQRSRNRKSGLYAAHEVLDELTRYGRALATPSGDKRSGLPSRRTPQRSRR